MKKQIITSLSSLLFGFGFGFIVFGVTNNNEGSIDDGMVQHSNMSPAGMHSEVEVDKSLPIPSVTLEAVPDSKDGYNLEINVSNFTFSPEKAGKENEPNTGHAHIYVNDNKVGRVYGSWYYLPSKYLDKGENTVKVTLNSNDHSDWLVNGEHIESSVMVTK